MSDLKKLSETSPFGRELFALAIPRMQDFPEILVLPSPHFALFLAGDARKVPADVILNLAHSLINQGLAYCCFWGPDCKRMHDLFDHAVFEHEPDATEYSIVKTTWHEYESLDEALRFFISCTVAAEKYAGTCLSALAVAVGAKEWSAQIEERLADPMRLSKKTSQGGEQT
ncbi:MAG TPA: hypothetical protein VGL91_10270 [Acidobacteriota bacterium]